MAFSAVMLLYSLVTTPLYLALFFISEMPTEAPMGKGMNLYRFVSITTTGGTGIGVIPPEAVTPFLVHALKKETVSRK